MIKDNAELTQEDTVRNTNFMGEIDSLNKASQDLRFFLSRFNGHDE